MDSADRVNTNFGAPFMSGVRLVTGKMPVEHFVCTSVAVFYFSIDTCIYLFEKSVLPFENDDTGLSTLSRRGISKGIDPAAVASAARQ